MTVVDVHTHVLTLDWIALLKTHGGVYDVKPTKAGQSSIWKDRPEAQGKRVRGAAARELFRLSRRLSD